MPAIPASIPEPPEFVTGYGVEEWRRLAPELYRLGLLTVADITSFGGYCRAYDAWRVALQAFDQVAAENPATRGLTVVTSQGLIANPLLSVVRQAATEMRRQGAEFGLSPASRTRIHVGITKDNGKFAGLLAA
jgi:P27 family predicted phage terminase small subunit